MPFSLPPVPGFAFLEQSMSFEKILTSLAIRGLRSPELWPEILVVELLLTFLAELLFLLELFLQGENFLAPIHISSINQGQGVRKVTAQRSILITDIGFLRLDPQGTQSCQSEDQVLVLIQ